MNFETCVHVIRWKQYCVKKTDLEAPQYAGFAERRVLCVWWLQSGAVCLVATGRCCVSGGYRLVLCVWWLQSGAVCSVSLYFITAQISTTVPNQWPLSKANPVTADTLCSLWHTAINFCDFPSLKAQAVPNVRSQDKKEGAEKSANFVTELSCPGGRYCEDIQHSNTTSVRRTVLLGYTAQQHHMSGGRYCEEIQHSNTTCQEDGTVRIYSTATPHLSGGRYCENIQHSNTTCQEDDTVRIYSTATPHLSGGRYCQDIQHSNTTSVNCKMFIG